MPWPLSPKVRVVGESSEGYGISPYPLATLGTTPNFRHQNAIGYTVKSTPKGNTLWVTRRHNLAVSLRVTPGNRSGFQDGNFPAGNSLRGYPRAYP
jgi:hypothetical protein